MKHFDKSINKLSNMFPDMGNLLENIKQVSNTEADISDVLGYLNGKLVSVDVYILDTKYGYEAGDSSVGVNEGFMLESYTATAKIFSDEESDHQLVGEIPSDQFSKIVQVDKAGNDLDTFVSDWLNMHADQYAPQPADRDSDDGIDNGEEFYS